MEYVSLIVLSLANKCASRRSSGQLAMRLPLLHRRLSSIRNRRVDHDAAQHAVTVICPRCGIDSVLGDKSGSPLTREFLAEMQENTPTRTVPQKNAAGHRVADAKRGHSSSSTVAVPPHVGQSIQPRTHRPHRHRPRPRHRAHGITR